MELTTSVDGTLAKVAIVGKLTVATSPTLEETVRQMAETATSFEIDLSELEYISSAGLRVLVTTQKLASGRGGTMRLLHPTESVQEVFEMTGLSEVLTIEL